MSEEQLSALLAKLKEDAGLQEKFKGAADLDAAVAMVKEAGFDVSKEDWISYQNNHIYELSDNELENVCGGVQQCHGGQKSLDMINENQDIIWQIY
jgi:predicted ribosomally synthesized peptide with nif11-like leader